MNTRSADIKRDTTETQIQMHLDLDRSSDADIDIGIPFLAHMLEQVARHGNFGLTIKATGDLEVDDHHTVEDLGITLGQCFDKALGDKKGIARYGFAYVPLDEALARVVIDFSGRPGIQYNAHFPSQRIKDFDTGLIAEFFHGFTNHAKATLHIDSLRGANSHHIAETVFKAFAKACRMAVDLNPHAQSETPSTKGML